MDQPNRIRQLYGYAVCLTAVITALLSINSAMKNGIDLTNPVAVASQYGGASFVSFDAYLASRQQFGKRDTGSVTTQRQRFEALRASKIEETIFTARKQLVTDLTLLIVAVALFVTHWRWMRRLKNDATTKATS